MKADSCATAREQPTSEAPGGTTFPIESHEYVEPEDPASLIEEDAGDGRFRDQVR